MLFIVDENTVSCSMRSKTSFQRGAVGLDMKAKTFLRSMCCMFEDSGSEAEVEVNCGLLSDMTELYENNLDSKGFYDEQATMR
jgi:hypothetical protein